MNDTPHPVADALRVNTEKRVEIFAAESHMHRLLNAAQNMRFGLMALAAFGIASDLKLGLAVVFAVACSLLLAGMADYQEPGSASAKTYSLAAWLTGALALVSAMLLLLFI